MKREKRAELTPEQRKAKLLKAAALCVAVIFAIIGAVLSHFLVENWLHYTEVWQWIGTLFIGAAVFGLFGLTISPMVIGVCSHVFNSLTNRLFKIPLVDIICSVFGLICGLVIGSLLGSAIEKIAIVGPYIAFAVLCAFGYVGLWLGNKKKDEIVGIITTGLSRISVGKDRPPKSERERDRDHVKAVPKILDTSVIIDGRIAEIYATGFLEGNLIIPGFVLIELQHIADSADPLKRLKGRRGLDILNSLRENFKRQVQVVEKDYPDIAEVDLKLLKMAKDLKGAVITNDFNLNKVAGLQDVQVLNINDLANSLKPIFPPGEEMTLKIIKDGKENNQGVGYLDDGTMIVVENGRRYLGKTIRVVVTSVLQTSAGRMIFARPLGNKKPSREMIPENVLLETGETAPVALLAQEEETETTD